MIFTNWKIFDRYLHMFFHVCRIPIQHNEGGLQPPPSQGGGAFGVSPLVMEIIMLVGNAADMKKHMQILIKYFPICEYHRFY